MAQYRINNPSFRSRLDRINRSTLHIVARVLREERACRRILNFLGHFRESSLISDAVSTSNAVGFWQFKKATAEEVNLRVDQEIDERKSIVSATRGAATYLKKHQSYLDNWGHSHWSPTKWVWGGARNYYKDRYRRAANHGP